MEDKNREQLLREAFDIIAKLDDDALKVLLDQMGFFGKEQAI